jgi:hypothetical protein
MGKIDIVESDHRYVLAYAHAGAFQGAHSPDGSQIIATQNRGRKTGLLKQSERGCGAPIHFMIALEDSTKLDPAVFECFQDRLALSFLLFSARETVALETAARSATSLMRYAMLSFFRGDQSRRPAGFASRPRVLYGTD